MLLTTSTPSSRRVDAGAEGAVALAERLGHDFADLSLLQHALAHRSWCGEQEGGAPSNERLEFLGDAVLGLVVARYTYGRFPDFPEGKLAKVRSAVVNARVLAQVAGSLGIGEVLLLGRGEEGSGGRTKASILADAFEAVLGAVYLDAGWEAAERLVLRQLGEPIERAGDVSSRIGMAAPGDKKTLRSWTNRFYACIDEGDLVEAGSPEVAVCRASLLAVLPA